LIDIIDTDAAAEDANVEANAEIGRKHGQTRTVLLEDHLALEENALGSAAVCLAGLTDHNGVILQMVQNDQFANAVVLEAALNHAFLEITIKSEHLYLL
jgi:hypothetical protein